jgi:mannose-6-phosphate isomerase-like protein (cupin superfamily)
VRGTAIWRVRLTWSRQFERHFRGPIGHMSVEMSQLPINSLSKEKSNSELAPYVMVDFAMIAGTPCPCGEARRAFYDAPDLPATVHVTSISIDAQKHYHKTHSEVYYFLECEPNARIELNEEILPVSVGQAILIRAGTRHRALGKMKVLIVSFPKFDPADEWLN